MSAKIKKRFIAGAICPRCSEVDKLVTYKDNGKEFRECVSCGFHDEMRFQQTHRELDTRVNVTKEQLKADTQVLTFEVGSTKKKSD